MHFIVICFILLLFFFISVFSVGLFLNNRFCNHTDKGVTFEMLFMAEKKHLIDKAKSLLLVSFIF